MSTVATETDVGQSVVLHGVSWEQYERLLDVFSDRRFRHTYDRGTLEIMSPSPQHESLKTFIGRLVERLPMSATSTVADMGP
jgi:Uma2 family endonuclease